jgi:hypothetical protein
VRTAIRTLLANWGRFIEWLFYFRYVAPLNNNFRFWSPFTALKSADEKCLHSTNGKWDLSYQMVILLPVGGTA